MKTNILFIATIVIYICFHSIACSVSPPPLIKPKNKPVEEIQLPEGFEIAYFAENVPNARSLCLGEQGVVFVGNRKKDKVYALIDKNADYAADTMIMITEDKNMPNGVAFHDGDLYVAEVSKIWRYDDIETKLLANEPVPKPVLISDVFPTDTHHGWKFIRFGPDGKLYIPVGAPCNTCDKEAEDKRYATIMRMNPDGSELEVFASGVRNSVGFDWHPKTGELWFTDNGRDWMGDDLPPCELNKASQKGLHFGYPFCHGGTITDPEFGKDRACSEFVAPVQNLGPHVAPLGMRFYTGNMFPESYHNQVFIAEHGSWNRSNKIGYRITLVRIDESGKALSYEDFATGWLREGKKVWGRPVDLMQMPDGSLLVSDDFADAIYRICYVGG